MADVQTISALATAGGTLVLAVATFSAVRSSNRSARVAEQALMTGMRPLLLPSLSEDPVHKVLWSDRHTAHLAGGRAVVEEDGGVIYLAIGVRNVGPGLALLHGWHPIPFHAMSDTPPGRLDEFRRLTLDLYVPAGATGYWEGAVREPDDPVRAELSAAVSGRTPFTVEVLYGDQVGGQRTISRFAVLPAGDGGWFCQSGRHWNIDRPDPR